MTEEKKIVAPAKKTVAKKAPAKKAIEEVTEVVEAVKVEKKPEKRKIGSDENIEIMNNTTGRYKYVSNRSGFTVEMNDYADLESIPFGELRTMSSSQKRHITDAFIVILDEDAVKELGYEKLYENVVNREGIEELLADHEKLDEILPKMPKTMRETIGAIAKRKFKNKELYDTRVKAVIEKNLAITIDV